MKKVLLAVSVFFIMLTSYALAAELTVTDFSVSGNNINAKGFITGAENARASIYIENGGAVAYIGQAEAEQDGSFDLSFVAPSNINGSYTAHIGATECVAKTVSFTCPGNQVYITYTPPTEEDTPSLPTDTTIDVNAVKRVSKVDVSGTVKNKQSDDDKVMLVIKKTNGGNINKDTVAYIDQTSLDENGAFSFSFSFYGDLTGYEAYLYADGRNISDSIENATTKYDLVTAEVEVSKVLDKAVLLAKLTNAGNEDAPYTMILTMYDKNNVMVGMKAEDGVVKGSASGQGTIELRIPEETVRIKAMLWNSREEMIPIAKPITANH